VHGEAGSRLIIDNLSAPIGPSGRLIDFVLDSTFTRPRSWHEIVPGKAFQNSQNKLLISLSSLPAEGEIASPKGTIHVSDIVLLYHATST
jgi:hypothetical protein